MNHNPAKHINPINALLEELEEQRQSSVIIIASARLDLDMLPPLYEQLSRLAPTQKLDVVFYSRGGQVIAARRIGLLLKRYCEELSFFVPHYCESAGTIAALSADQVVTTPLSLFSPVDPQLMSGADGGPQAIAAEDLRLLAQACQNWFGISEEEARQAAAQACLENIFPATLTAFYRSTLETQAICHELLALHMADEKLRQRIVKQLQFSYHSHHFPLSGDDLDKMGLPIREANASEEALLHKFRQALVDKVGASPENDPQYGRVDALIQSRHAAVERVSSPDYPARWESWT